MPTSYGGKKLFFRTGWRKGGVNIQDNYLHSRAFNLVLPDGQGQKRSVKSNGYMPRFVHGDRMTYSLGDASATYPEEVELERFRRHVIHLKPHHVIVYDELVSGKNIPWTYVLNAHDEIKKISDNVVSVHNGKGLGVANLFCSSSLSTEVTDQFYGMEGKKIKRPLHWHCYAKTDESQGIRFLNVIDITPSENPDEQPVPLKAEGHELVKVRVGDYTVSAQVSATKAPYLEIRSDDGQCALIYGEGSRTISLDGREALNARFPFSTLFVEKNTPYGDIMVEAVDQLPDAVIYGNRY